MQRKKAELLSNCLMGVGTLIMLVGAGSAILVTVTELNSLHFLAEGAIVAIFVGALIWLLGASVGGRDRVADRYWWVKNFDKRCCNNQHRSSLLSGSDN